MTLIKNPAPKPTDYFIEFVDPKLKKRWEKQHDLDEEKPGPFDIVVYVDVSHEQEARKIARRIARQIGDEKVVVYERTDLRRAHGGWSWENQMNFRIDEEGEEHEPGKEGDEDDDLNLDDEAEDLDDLDDDKEKE